MISVIARQAIPMLRIAEGDAVFVKPQSHYDADSSYLTHSGAIIRLACAFKPGVLRISEQPGDWRETAKGSAENLIAGRVTRIEGNSSLSQRNMIETDAAGTVDSHTVNPHIHR